MLYRKYSDCNAIRASLVQFMNYGKNRLLISDIPIKKKIMYNLVRGCRKERSWLEPIIYVAIYTLEAFCTISASYMLFRFPFREFIWKKFVLSVVLAIFSYSLRDLTIINEFTIIVPLTYLLAYTLFINFVSKIRFLWASVMMTTGYAVVSVIQMLVVPILGFFGISIEMVQGNLGYLALGQILTAAIVIPFSFIYYFHGYGFTYEFPSWRWKHLWLVVLELLLIAILLRFVYINMLLTLIIAAILTLVALLILSRSMEKEEITSELEL